MPVPGDKQPGNRKQNKNKKDKRHGGGPKTEAGIDASSQNSITHGILSEHLVLKGEKQEDFNQLLDDLSKSLKPVGAIEDFLVERIAISIWRQKRLVSAEKEQIELQRIHLRTEARIFAVEALETEVKLLEANGDSNILAKAGTKVFAKIEVEYDVNKQAIEQTAIPDWAQLENEAPHIITALQIEAQKNNQSVVDFLLKNYGSIAEWVKFKIRLQKAALENLKKRSPQGATENGQANDVAAASKLAENNTSNTVQESRWIPANMDVLGRYQTMLDNQVYKALRAFWDAREAREKENQYTGPGDIVSEQ